MYVFLQKFTAMNLNLDMSFSGADRRYVATKTSKRSGSDSIMFEVKSRCTLCTLMSGKSVQTNDRRLLYGVSAIKILLFVTAR